MTSDSVISLISNSGIIKILGGIGGKTNLMRSVGVSQAAILKSPNLQGEAEWTNSPRLPRTSSLSLVTTPNAAAHLWGGTCPMTASREQQSQIN